MVIGDTKYIYYRPSPSDRCNPLLTEIEQQMSLMYCFFSYLQNLVRQMTTGMIHNFIFTRLCNAHGTPITRLVSSPGTLR